MTKEQKHQYNLARRSKRRDVATRRRTTAERRIESGKLSAKKANLLEWSFAQGKAAKAGALDQAYNKASKLDAATIGKIKSSLMAECWSDASHIRKDQEEAALKSGYKACCRHFLEVGIADIDKFALHCYSKLGFHPDVAKSKLPCTLL
jgi:hypothetical protein